MTKFDKSASTDFVSGDNPLPVENQALLSPQVEAQFVYNVNPAITRTLVANGGSVSHSGSSAVVSTGTDSEGLSTLQSRRIMQHHPGRLSGVRFDGAFTQGVADSEQIIGAGNVLNGLFFGYDGEDFGILRRSGGIPQIQELTITNPSVHDEQITITLDGVSVVTVPVTNTNDETITAHEIASFDYLAEGLVWIGTAVGDRVIFVSEQAKSQQDIYSVSNASSTAGTFTEITEGVTPNDRWTRQSHWSVDKMLEDDPDGLGSTGIHLEPTFGNTYEIRYDFPRFGNIEYRVGNPTTGRFAVVHREGLNNQSVAAGVSNPSFPCYVFAQNQGNTTDISAFCTTMYGYTAGPEIQLGPHFSAGTLKPILTTNEEPILTLRNKLEYMGQINATLLKPTILTLSSNLKDEKENLIFRFYAGGTPLTGTNYEDVDIDASTAQVDVDSTAFDVEGVRPQGPIVLGSTDNKTLNLTDLDSIIYPGQVLLVTAQATKAGPDNIVGVDLSWRETI